jgi:hypothetical protein
MCEVSPPSDAGHAVTHVGGRANDRIRVTGFGFRMRPRKWSSIWAPTVGAQTVAQNLGRFLNHRSVTSLEPM